MRTSSHYTQQGSVLLTVLAMVVVLLAISGSILNIVSHEYMLSKRSLAWNQSLFTAETGVEFGYNEINKLTAVNTNSAFMAGGNWTYQGNGAWSTSSTRTLTATAGTELSTTYTVTVNTNNWCSR